MAHMSRGATDFFVSLLEAVHTTRTERAARGGRVHIFSEAAPPPVGFAAAVHEKMGNAAPCAAPPPGNRSLGEFPFNTCRGKDAIFLQKSTHRPLASIALRGVLQMDRKAFGRFRARNARS